MGNYISDIIKAKVDFSKPKTGSFFAMTINTTIYGGIFLGIGFINWLNLEKFDVQAFGLACVFFSLGMASAYVHGLAIDREKKVV